MTNRPTHGNWQRQMSAMAISFCAVVALMSVSCSESLAKEQLTEGSSSKQFRTQTAQSIPYHLLNQQTRDKISGILKKPSIYRRLPVTAINADPDYFRFLVRYPEVVVNIWQLMGVTNMSTERTGPYSISSNDGAGTISSLELVYGNENLHIFYGTGSYEGPILKRKLTGQCVLVLRSENKQGANGKAVATSQLDVYLKIENATASLIAKTIQPLVGTTADHNFVESMHFVQRLNETTEKNGPGVQKMGEKLKIDPNVRQQFNKVVDVVFQRAINSAAPAPTLLETQYPSRQPTRNMNSQFQNQNRQAPTQQAPAYESLRDVGQYRSTQPNAAQAYYAYPTGQPNYASPRGPGAIQNGHGLPARGFLPPSYSGPNAGYYGYGNQPSFGRPIQASYDSYGRSQDSNAAPPAGWQPRR